MGTRLIQYSIKYLSNWAESAFASILTIQKDVRCDEIRSPRHLHTYGQTPKSVEAKGLSTSRSSRDGLLNPLCPLAARRESSFPGCAAQAANFLHPTGFSHLRYSSICTYRFKALRTIAALCDTAWTTSNVTTVNTHATYPFGPRILIVRMPRDCIILEDQKHPSVLERFMHGWKLLSTSQQEK